MVDIFFILFSQGPTCMRRVELTCAGRGLKRTATVGSTRTTSTQDYLEGSSMTQVRLHSPIRTSFVRTCMCSKNMLAGKTRSHRRILRVRSYWSKCQKRKTTSLPDGLKRIQFNVCIDHQQRSKKKFLLRSR